MAYQHIVLSIFSFLVLFCACGRVELEPLPDDSYISGDFPGFGGEMTNTVSLRDTRHRTIETISLSPTYSVQIRSIDRALGSAHDTVPYTEARVRIAIAGPVIGKQYVMTNISSNARSSMMFTRSRVREGIPITGEQYEYTPLSGRAPLVLEISNMEQDHILEASVRGYIFNIADHSDSTWVNFRFKTRSYQ